MFEQNKSKLNDGIMFTFWTEPQALFFLIQNILYTVGSEANLGVKQ